MKRLIPIPIAVAFTAILFAMAPAAQAQTADSGADVYQQSCARCHQSDGTGVAGTFPPLANNPDVVDPAYVADVVTNGLEGKEIMGVGYDSAMPSFANRLSPEEIDAVAGYVAELGGGGGAAPASTTTVPQGPVSESAGEDIFTGATPLANGGTACIACHEAGKYDRLAGPGMAMDLNGIVDSYGQAGFVSAITDPLVDPMVAVFGDHPITDKEANDLAAFLETTQADAGNSDTSIDLLVAVGLLGFVVLMLIAAGFVKGPQDTYVEKLRSSR